jgi:hypothetical protein
MFSALLLNPAQSPKFVGKLCEAFQIQCQDEVDVPCEPTDVHETKQGGCPDDHDVRFESVGNRVNLGEIL